MSNILFFFEDVSPFNFNKSILRKHIKEIINNEQKRQGDISIIFCSDEYLLRLNEQYLNHHYYTDVITFDYVENSVIAGDLFISVDRLKENATKFGVTFKKEMCRVIFHGVLHLVGYNDKTTKEKALIRDKEEYYLKGIDFSAEGL